ncbi:DUF5665 domain-containing protein [Patescibacteria group bacterium]|nr:DUF5665 domain-containing protein [Patescibacteria group bacterium]
MEDKNIVKTLDKLEKAISDAYLNKKKLMFRSFLSGIAYGLGITIGLFIVLLIVGLILDYIVNIPVFNILKPLASHVKTISSTKIP